MMLKQQKHTAFTLIELLVVISIISLLMAILLPALGKAREAARKLRCLSNVRQINVGTFAYLADNNEVWMRGQNYNNNIMGDYGRVPDFYSLYQNYFGRPLKDWDTTASGIDGNTYYAYDIRFNPADIFICPSRVRTLSSPSSHGNYNYYRSAYAFYPASNLQFKMTQEKLLRGGMYANFQTYTRNPATWSDRCNVSLTDQGNNGGPAETNHWDPKSLKPTGGNVARADGSALWFPYEIDTYKKDAFVVNGGSIGSHIAIPSNAVFSQMSGYNNQTTPRAILGRNSTTNFSAVFGD